MATGRVHQALHMLIEEMPDEADAGVLQMEEMVMWSGGEMATVREVLSDKHPKAQKPAEDILFDGNPGVVNPIRFEALTPNLLQRVALQCKGSAGPSGLNADAWRRFCLSFKGASTKLCQALAGFAHLIATHSLEASTLVPFLSCRLIALNKNPGVRPIGVCEVVRCIVTKAILRVVGNDVEEACGYMQKCSGLITCRIGGRSGCYAAAV